MNIKRIWALIDTRNAECRSEFEHDGEPPYDCIDVHGGISQEEVNELAQILGITFCADYVQFLIEFGSIYDKVGDLYHGGIGKKRRPDGEGFSDYFIDMNEKFFRDIYKGPAFSSGTLFHEADNGEWYSIIDHEKSIVTAYDPFKKSLDMGVSCSLEDYLVRYI